MKRTVLVARHVALILALAVLAAVAAACGGRSPPPETAEDVEDPAEARAVGEPEAGAPASGSPRRGGEVARVELNQVLDAGPGAFLARGEVKVRLVKGQFGGWRVVRTPFPDIDLVAGDVLLSVNGRRLEHPVDLERLWSDLRAANTIDVDVERRGQRFALRFAVVPKL